MRYEINRFESRVHTSRVYALPCTPSVDSGISCPSAPLIVTLKFAIEAVHFPSGEGAVAAFPPPGKPPPPPPRPAPPPPRPAPPAPRPAPPRPAPPAPRAA